MTSAIVPMKSDFDGFCNECKAELSKGTPRMVHRYSKRIYCCDCGQKAAGVKKTDAGSGNVEAYLKAIKAGVDALQPLLQQNQKQAAPGGEYRGVCCGWLVTASKQRPIAGAPNIACASCGRQITMEVENG